MLVAHSADRVRVLRHAVRATLALTAVLVIACSGSSTTAPDPASQLPGGTASMAIFGNFSVTQRDSIVQPNVIARMWRDAPIPSNAQHPFLGATGLILTWPGTPGGTRPEPQSFFVRLPYNFGRLPRMLSIVTDSLDAGLGAGRVNNGLVAYTASAGTVTITSVTDSTLTGTVNVGFERGPVGAHLIMTGAFNATRCNTQVDVYTNPCQPPQVY